MTTNLTMDQDLWSFISKYREYGDNYNFSSQFPSYTGKFRIERKDLESFWKLYCDTLQNKPDMMAGILELRSECGPLRVDVDLSIPDDKYPDNSLAPLYNEREVLKVIEVYQRVIRETIRDWKAIYCMCFLLEKKPYRNTSKKEIKHGFHLHFPRLWIRQCDHDIHILPRVISILNKEHKNLFRLMPDENTGNYIDKGVATKNWLLYGCRKNAFSGSYMLTKIYDCRCNLVSLAEALTNFQLLDVNENNLLDDIKTNSEDDTEKMLTYYLPRILSIHPANKEPIRIKTGLEIAIKQQINTVEDISHKRANTSVIEAVQQAKELMPLINENRSNNRDEWLEMGWVLYCIGDGCQECLDIWISFSSKTKRNNFDEAKCIYEWQRMCNTGNYTIGTLKYFARIDNPEAYKAWQHQKFKSRIQDSLHGGHNDIAKMLRDWYGNTYICAGYKEQLWYEYVGHKWKRIEKGISLRQKISDELVQYFNEDYKKILFSSLNEEGGNNEDIQKNISMVQKLTEKFKHAGFKDSVMKEAAEVFYHKTFLERLDSDTCLLGFNNGVLDIRTCTFREGSPDDFISLSTGYDFKEFAEDDPQVIEVDDFLAKIFPDPELRRYFLENAARLLKGGNTQKTFLVMSGEGDNGKSVTIEFLEATLGEYALHFPTSLVTGKRTQSSGCTPEIARIHGIRLAVMQEPDNGDVLNTGIIKELTGNDKIYTRGLYKEGKEIRPQCKVILVCNALPRVGTNDQAIWNRIRVLLFEAWFPKDKTKVPSTIEEQVAKKIFPRDDSLTEKFNSMKQAFMWRLVKTYREMTKNGPTPEPYKVTDATRKYRCSNDVFLQFIEESIDITNNPSDCLSIQELFSTFVQWFRDSFPRSTLPIKNELKEYLIKKWGEPIDKLRCKWPGVKIRSIADEVARGTAVVISMNELKKNSDEKSMHISLANIDKNVGKLLENNQEVPGEENVDINIVDDGYDEIPRRLL